jgi:integrase
LPRRGEETVAKKRGNGEGSIYKRKNGRWVGQYLVHTAAGPKYRYIYGKTRQAVAERLTNAMADRDGGLIFDAAKMTLGEYLDHWLADSVKGTVRASTYERHEAIVATTYQALLGPRRAQEAHLGTRARALS